MIKSCLHLPLSGACSRCASQKPLCCHLSPRSAVNQVLSHFCKCLSIFWKAAREKLCKRLADAPRPLTCLSPASPLAELPLPPPPFFSLSSASDITPAAAQPFSSEPLVLHEPLGSEKRLQSARVQKQPTLSNGNPWQG